MGVYSVRTFRQDKTVYHSEMRNHQNSVYMQYKEGEPAPNPMETVLSALSSCKLVNFWDLAEKYKIAFEDASIESQPLSAPTVWWKAPTSPRVRSSRSTPCGL